MNHASLTRRATRRFTRALRRIEGRHRAWRYRARLDPAEIAWMRRTLQGGSAVVDGGAYRGGYTLWMRESVGESGLVYAFEPQPELAAFLMRSVDAFGWDNVLVHAVGLGSTAGERTMHVPESKPSQRGSLVVERAGAHTYPVRVQALDDFLRTRPAGRRIALIKCDVEGSELDVFRGARRTLINHRPTLLFEHEARFCPRRDAGRVFDYLEALGYRGSFFWKGELLPISEFRFDIHQVEGHRPYANNFVFEPD